MARKSQPTRADEKTDAPESMADHVVIQNTIVPHCNWLIDYDAIKRVWNSFELREIEVESGIDRRKTKVRLPIKTVDDYGRIDRGGEYWSQLKPLLGHGVENNPKFCQFVWDYQISIVRNKPSRVSDIVSFLPRLSHFVSFSEGGVILPALYFSEGVSYTPRELFDIWMRLSGCAIFGRKQIGEPFARLSVSELPVAKFDISKERVTFEQGQESLPLTFYDVLIVSPYDVDRFDCQTGKIRPIVPAVGLDGEGVSGSESIVSKDLNKTEKTLEYMLKKYPNGWPAIGLKQLLIELNEAGFMVRARTLNNVKKRYLKRN